VRAHCGHNVRHAHAPRASVPASHAEDPMGDLKPAASTEENDRLKKLGWGGPLHRVGGRVWIDQPFGPDEVSSFVTSCGLTMRSELNPNDACRALNSLIFAFRKAEARIRKVATQENVTHIRKLTKQATKLMRALQSSRTKQVYDDDDGTPFARLRPVYALPFALDDFISSAVCVEDHLSKEVKKGSSKGNLSDLEQFIRGPLSQCYIMLAGRQAGGRKGGPFSRFGEKFFATLGFPVSAATIVRSLRERTSNAPRGRARKPK
jgi:hypothetical protein